MDVDPVPEVLEHGHSGYIPTIQHQDSSTVPIASTSGSRVSPRPPTPRSATPLPISKSHQLVIDGDGRNRADKPAGISRPTNEGAEGSMQSFHSIASKGKGKATSASPIDARSLPPLGFAALFAQTDLERLKVENEQLKLQLAVMANKRKQSALNVHSVSSGSSSHTTEPTTSPSSLNRMSHAEAAEFHRKLQYSERQRQRLQTELSSLRSYLLSSVHPVSPVSENEDEHDHVSPGGLESLPGAASRVNGPTSARKRGLTMGDAETEHLLLASARITRLHKAVNSRTLSSDSRRGTQPQTQPKRRYYETDLQNVPESPMRSSQCGPTRTDDDVYWHAKELSPRLGSPIRTSRIKLEDESPQLNYRTDAARVFRDSPSLELAETPGRKRKQSHSASPAKSTAKIGRPLGSANKTKLVSINETVASKRRAKSRNAQASVSRDGSVLPRQDHEPLAGPSRRSAPAEPARAVNELLYAANQLEPAFGDADMDADEDWPDSIQQEIDAEQYERNLAKCQPLSRENASARNVPSFQPLTPASLEQPDVHRYQRPHSSGHPVYPPETPGQHGQARSTFIPPQTPDALHKELSGLDVLAEEAASARQDNAPRQSQYAADLASTSARNLVEEMEQAGQSSSWNGSVPDFASSSYGATAAGQQRPSLASTSTHNGHHPLGEPFRQQSNYNGPRTIAEQLARGVEVDHPLIDPEDLEAGMTPAAALAKKSRSPYVKWTNEEDEVLVQGVAEHGTRWEAVARMLPNRSYHQCRQRWLRGLRSGDALPKKLAHLKPQIDAAIQAYESSRVSGRKAEN